MNNKLIYKYLKNKVGIFFIVLAFLGVNLNVLYAQNSSDPNVFKITNWNTDWLGCTRSDFGPSDKNLQLNNVAIAMQTMNSDIFCLQEISNASVIPSLLSMMGSDWGGNITSTANCTQRQGIIFKKSKVQFVKSSELTNGISAEGNTYSTNWSSGRYPALYNVNLVTDDGLIPLSIVNIHAKAYADQASYTRRKGGSEGLKAILDGSPYNTENIIIIGDFNDYLIGSMCYTCGDSPYKNFMDDYNNYEGVTKDIKDADPAYFGEPIIENIIISNELFGKCVAGSVQQEVTIPQSINNYYITTSDHLPVSAFFNFGAAAAINNIYSAGNLLRVYPNPVKDELRIEGNDPFSDLPFTIYNVVGKQVVNGKWLNSNSLNVGGLQSGIYILKVGNLRGKFVKE